MNRKTSLKISAVVGAMVLAVSVASAHPGMPGGRGGEGGGRGMGMLDGRGGLREFGGPLRDAFRLIVEELGLEPGDVLTQLRDGKTLAGIINENGGTVEDAITLVMDAATERAAQAVENGRITQERADELLATLEENLNIWINSTLDELADSARLRASTAALVPAVATETGLTRIEIRDALEAGQTLAEILTANGADVDAFIADQISKAQEHLTRAVENGRITQEQADARLAEIQEALPAVLNGQVPAAAEGESL